MRKKTFEIVAEYPLKGGLYPISLTSITRKSHSVFPRSKNLEQWHRKLGHICSDRLLKLSKTSEDVPNYDNEMRKHLECIPCITAKTRRSTILDSTRKTNRRLELIQLDIFGKVEESLLGYKCTVAILDDFTAKSDVIFEKNRSELIDSLKIYKSQWKSTPNSKSKAHQYPIGSRRGNLSGMVVQFCNEMSLALNLHRHMHRKVTAPLKD